MREDLLKFIEEFNIIDRSTEMFRENFEDYKINDVEEFNKNFYKYNEKDLKVYIKKISFNLGDSPDWDYEYITVRIEMMYKNMDVGYYMSCFDKKGNCIDDYFVIF